MTFVYKLLPCCLSK